MSRPLSAPALANAIAKLTETVGVLRARIEMAERSFNALSLLVKEHDERDRTLLKKLRDVFAPKEEDDYGEGQH